MIFDSLSLFNFKNFPNEQFAFVPQVNCIVGKNGVGKTNILDALHYLSLGKSAINPIDSANILHDEQSFFIRAKLMRHESQHEILCSVQIGKKKSIKVNHKEYEKLSEHVGFMPVVMITPNDISLINDGHETRRKFFDSTLSQIERPYMHNLVRYQKALKQRNSLLKHFAETMTIDKARLEPFDHELLGLGKEIYQQRSDFLHEFCARFNKLYKKLSSNHEQVAIVYESDWQASNVMEKYHNSLKRDLALQRTSVGIHRDAYHFNIGSKPLKRFGSQGQQKSLIVALKIAQFDALKKSTKVTPVLLLDDIFDKLDDQRMGILMKMVCKKTFGQIFITDARPERTKEVLADNILSARILTIEDGKLLKTEDYEPKA